MESSEDVVERGDMAVGLASRCRRPADWNRLGWYKAGSRSRMVGGIGSWGLGVRIKCRAGVRGRSLPHRYAFISHRGTVERQVKKLRGCVRPSNRRTPE